ncbi:MAG: GNAT family N-acetyltransferase [Bacteroidetes bacterium]|nr:GNAT family N-acetyltransferase [Bacteroidota bacterium]
MQLHKYDITLSRLTEDDIEMVRQWRNSQQIRQFMEYREEITPEMQKKWFESINDFYNFYFIIEFEGEKIGLINTSKANYDDQSSEGGIFLWDDKYYETFVPVWASLLLLETNLFLFDARKSYIKTLHDNERAKRLNLHLGYELMEGQENEYNQEYKLTRENFIKKARKLIQAASLLSEDRGRDHWIFYNNEDIRSGLYDFMKEKMNREFIKSEEDTPEGKYIYIEPTPF